LSMTKGGPTTVNPAAASRLSITAPVTATAGRPFTITVTAFDPYNNVATGYRGTVHFTSSDGLASLPHDFAFTSSDDGKHTFRDGVTLQTPGIQTISVRDVVRTSIAGTVKIQVGQVASLGVVTSNAVKGAENGHAIRRAYLGVQGPRSSGRCTVELGFVC